jgi:hypothetical protein
MDTFEIVQVIISATGVISLSPGKRFEVSKYMKQEIEN